MLNENEIKEVDRMLCDLVKMQNAKKRSFERRADKKGYLKAN